MPLIKSEKIQLAPILARSWNDPSQRLNVGIIGGALTSIIGGAALWNSGHKYGKCLSPLPLLSIIGLYEVKHRTTAPAPLQNKYITFKCDKAKKRWEGKKIPAGIFINLYLDDHVDFTMDVLEALENMDDFLCYMPSWGILKFLILQLFPNIGNSSVKDKKTTKREIAEHYNRGNDFFRSFLGKPMVYTSAVFEKDSDDLVSAQDNKMRKICEKVRLQPGDRFLDIGCGWGTLTGYAYRNFNADAKGVTLSEEGAKYSRENNPVVPGNTGKIDFLVTDYRDIPDEEKFNAISSVEMAEHVGLNNFQIYLDKVKRNLVDDGAFYMQVAGFRKGADWKDMAWALFMGEYIFPGADASTPLNWYIRELEQAGMEVESIENVGIHYSLTLNEWYKEWKRNEFEGLKIGEKYPGALCRLWRLFLAWSTLASRRGSATCWMISSHKVTFNDDFDRSKMIKNQGNSDKWTEAAKFPRFRKK